MSALNRNRIEIYAEEDFQGYKFICVKESKIISKVCHLLTSSVSIRVTGDTSWKIHGDKDSFVIDPGEYARLNHDCRGVSHIRAVEPVSLLQTAAQEIPSILIYEDPWAALGGWFLGPKAENIEFFCSLAEEAIQSHGEFRKHYFPTDKPTIGEEIKENYACKHEKYRTRQELKSICEKLKGSLPWGSIRYQAHQTGDVSMQAYLGYIAGLLYNPNNQVSEGAPITTPMEKEVAEDLCKMVGFGQDTTHFLSWGHITCDGSVANIEALWSSRNVKFYPLSVQLGLQDSRMSSAKNFMVYVPGAKKEKKLRKCSSWELLNLDIDDILAMPTKVREMAGVDKETYQNIVDSSNLANLGFAEFMLKFKLTCIPKVMASLARHYSWNKASALLGVGEKNIEGVVFEKNGRMDMDDLRKKLEESRQAQNPVISVVAVMGATETSAVDELVEILKIKEEFRAKGLTFAINADCAWGGYFCSMLHDSLKEGPQETSGYIPAFPLSPFVNKQLRSLKYVDTVTIDPHKTGFAPYPAGGLCYRNGNMKSFVRQKPHYLMSGPESSEVGLWGVEGSKPGAAAVGVLLGHRVIGLNKYGIGRILGQCIFGSKILYCIWMTLANDSDDFVCVPMKPLPPGFDLKEKQKFIKQHILGKDNEDLLVDQTVMDFLKEIGPDMLITAFSVNKRGNRDVNLCNQLVAQVAERCSKTSNPVAINRVKLFLAKSTFPESLYGEAEKQFKERLGLPRDSKIPLSYLINTNTNPWTTLNKGSFVLGKAARQAVLDALGQVFDSKDNHSFIGVGIITDNGEMFADYVMEFRKPNHQYHAVIKVQFLEKDAIDTIQKIQNESRINETGKLVLLECGNKTTLGSLLRDGMKKEQMFNVYVGSTGLFNAPKLTKKRVKVLDIICDNRFDSSEKEYPDNMTYLLYGDDNGAYLSHCIQNKPNFQQIVILDRGPFNVSKELLHQGIEITIQDMSGTPKRGKKGNIVDPLSSDSYKIDFPSYSGNYMGTLMSLKQSWAKVYFNAESD